MTAKRVMHLIRLSSTRALVTVAISTMPDGEFHRKSMYMQTKAAHIPHNIMILREVKVQIARWPQGGHPHFAFECANQLEDLGGDKITRLQDYNNCKATQSKRLTAGLK